ncbi:MAG: hypothetical protein GTO49_07585 [Anaerolineae bacterium]|nr:hypothetical protein [Anaerolineae bacterium]
MKLASGRESKRKNVVSSLLLLFLTLALVSGDEAISYGARVDFNNQGADHSVYLPLVLKSGHSGPWTDCSLSRLGSVLITWPDFDDSTGPELLSLAQDGYAGLAAATTYTDALEYFPQLEGWDKAQVCNHHECLRTRTSNSVRDGLAYDYLAYDPERLGGVPDEEKYNLPWATQEAREIADSAGKKLMISYSTEQLHLEALERGFGWDNPGAVVELLAPYGDAWLIQAADEYNNPNNPDTGAYGPILSQMHYPPGPEWRAEVARWVDWIESANPEIEIWIQLALHRIGVEGENYPSAELLLEYREWLVNPLYGPPLVEGVYITSIYSYPIDPVVADQEMEESFRLACRPESPPGEITLVEEGWTDSKSISGITLVPGYYYRIYENSRYPCGAQGNHQFIVLDSSPDDTTPKHLFAKFLGGGVGFWYYDVNNNRVYFPHQNAVGLLNETLNYGWLFRTSVSQEFANGVTKRFRENGEFRILAVSYCSHDLYHGRGECDDVDGFCRYGYLAAMDAVDYVQHNFNTGRTITYGGSAGAAGSFYIGKDQDNVAGIIMDSMAVDLGAIGDACLDGSNVFGTDHSNYPCCCPEPDPHDAPWCPDPYRTTCMEVLASRIGFTFGWDEPYHSVQRGEVDTPVYLVWNNNDASSHAGLHYWNLHNTLQTVNPAGNSVACRVCLPNSNPGTLNVCLDDSLENPQGSCSLHVPSAYDYDYTTWLVEDIYSWALALVSNSE